MKKNYETPKIEVIEIELEGAVLSMSDPLNSDIDDYDEYDSAW